MGGRGALLSIARNLDLFNSAAGISGIYDKISYKRSMKLISIYGPFSKHKERWEKTDNLLKLAPKLKNTPILIYCGKKDVRVPPIQSIIIAIKLKKFKKLQFIQDPKGTIEWRHFATKALPVVMKFFDKNLEK